jgi:hypothetical protein
VSPEAEMRSLETSNTGYKTAILRVFDLPNRVGPGHVCTARVSHGGQPR